MSKKVLITGADGFIGSHLAERLVRDGYDVRAFVMYNSFNSRGWLDQSPPELTSAMEILSGDIRDTAIVSQAVSGIDVVLHLAALIAIPFSYDAPETYLETNVRGTLNVLQAVRAAGNTRMIHTSTSEVYGTALTVPIAEDHRLNAQSPYAATKIAADQLALSYHASFGTPVCVLRPFNTYGPRQSARAVIPTIITQLLSGVSRIRLGSLHPTRDFNYVADTVGAFYALLEHPELNGTVINAGTNEEISIGDTARLITELIGNPIEIETDDQRVRPELSEVERLRADNTRARELLGWTPAYGGRDGLRRGLQETIQWFREGQNLARYRADIYNK